MLPRINGKSFLECSAGDLDVLIDNPDFRENEYLDYKENLAFLEMQKGKEREEKISEFRSDVCAFANADGGYLIIGIKDHNGCASEICGIDIKDDNTDAFELDRTNNLNPVQPRMPSMQYNFVKLPSGKYIVIIYVKHDGFAPYLFLEDQKNYRIYKRVGNGKRAVGYAELKNMFNQSLSLDREIYQYRKERVQYFQIYQIPFLLVHIIPDTFIDSSYNTNLAVIEQLKGIHFAKIFDEVNYVPHSTPCVDGLRFYNPNNIVQDAHHWKCDCYLHNSGVAECLYGLNDGHITKEIRLGDLWFIIQSLIKRYIDVLAKIIQTNRIFICVSIIGCKNYISQKMRYGYQGVIDRDVVLCSPIPIEPLTDDQQVEIQIKRLYIELVTSIGVKYDDQLKQFLDELYPRNN